MTKRKRIVGIGSGLAVAVIVLSAGTATAQVTQRAGVPAELANKLKPTPPQPLVAVPADYVIGAEDVLNIVVYNEATLSGEVTVRPDGRITLPVGNDIVALGLTPAELKEKVAAELKAGRFHDDPTVTIQVKSIKSRQVYITGSVGKPGPYALNGPMTVSMLISTAGGLQEFAKKKDLMLFRTGADGKTIAVKINYADLEKGRNVDKYDIVLRPGDRIIVPGGGA